MISSYESCTKKDWAIKNRIRCQKDFHAEFNDDRFDRKEAERRRHCRLSHAWR
jgi:endonuclease IV